MTMATPERRSVDLHWRTILLTVLDRDHITRGTCAIHWGRGADAHAPVLDVGLPIRGAGAGIGPRRRRSGRGGDATTARADVPVRAVGRGGAGRILVRTHFAGTGSYCSLRR